MADVKISALPASTTPLAGTEVLPIVQSSTTKQVSVADLTVGRSVSGSSFVPTSSTIPANGVYLPAANTVGLASNSTAVLQVFKGSSVALEGATTQTGVGITFPATQVASSNANTLDDYEEGTWTVNLYDAATGGNASATSTTGYYTKVGRLVTAKFQIDNISTAGMTGANVMYFTLPFSASNATSSNVGSLVWENTAFGVGYTFVVVSIEAAGARGYFLSGGSGVGYAAVIVSQAISTAADYRMCVSYVV
jgi:hypothetical protein